MRDSCVGNMSQLEPRVVLTRLDEEQECLTELSDTAERLLKFRLYEDTEGIWVCCDWCDRWRYLPDHHDPAFFFKRSFRCADAKKLCNVGHDDQGSDLIFYETKFCAGSLVWARRPDGRKAKNWIWWPALVEDYPDSVSQYFLLEGSSNVPTAYHVSYLDAHRTSGWMRTDLIKPFDPSAKGLLKLHDARRGKRQSSLRAAVERAIIASTYDVKGRLENFSYIAHMARLKGSITASKPPVDKILNGTEEAQATSTGSKLARDGVNETRRPRKRMLDKNRDEISNKKAKADASLTGKTRAAGKRSSREKADTKNQLESSGRADSQISDDSGYVIHEKSPNESSAHNIESRAATKVPQSGGDSKKPSRLKGPSFQDEGFESQDFGSSVDEPKKGGLDNKLERNESSQNGGGAKIPRKNTKGSVKKFQSTSGGSLESLESKNLARKQVQLKHSSLESSTKTSSKKETASTKKVSFESDSVDSESIKVNQDSRTEEINGLLPTSIETPPVSEQNSEMVDYDSESNTLEATSNLRVVRKRRAKKEDTLTASNGLPESTGFSQPPRQVGSADSRKRTGTNRRQETVGSAGTTPSFSMSQPAPSRNRGKFAPPTKARAEGVNHTNYTIDDFYRDLTDGVI